MKGLSYTCMPLKFYDWFLLNPFSTWALGDMLTHRGHNVHGLRFDIHKAADMPAEW